MRAFLFLIFIISAVFSNSGSSVNWLIDIDVAKTLAKERNQPIMLYLHSRACFYCRKYELEVFPDPVLNKYMKENFVLLSLDNSTDYDSDVEGQGQAPERFRSSFTPMIYFFGADEEKLFLKGTKHMIVTGFWPPEKLLNYMKNAKRRYEKRFGEQNVK